MYRAISFSTSTLLRPRDIYLFIGGMEKNVQRATCRESIQNIRIKDDNNNTHPYGISIHSLPGLTINKLEVNLLKN